MLDVSVIHPNVNLTTSIAIIKSVELYSQKYNNYGEFARAAMNNITLS